jgi:hypothetical protein
MAPDATKSARIAALKEEIHSIHFFNTLYWGRGEAATAGARGEYQHRLDRLEEIRHELAP